MSTQKIGDLAVTIAAAADVARPLAKEAYIAALKDALFSDGIPEQAPPDELGLAAWRLANAGYKTQQAACVRDPLYGRLEEHERPAVPPPPELIRISEGLDRLAHELRGLLLRELRAMGDDQ